MQLNQKHLILIGFKHVGKSVIGQALSNLTKQPFIDLDRCIESLFQARYEEKKTCRQIMQQRGEAFFRNLETQSLQQTLGVTPSIISLGGGTPLLEENQSLIRSYPIIHITAPKGIVFERIMIQGRPPFFPVHENPFDAFIYLWKTREKIYRQLTPLSIHNDDSISNAVTQVIRVLEDK